MSPEIEAQLDQLRHDAGRDRERIAAGRLDELAEAIVERHRAFERLSRQLGEDGRASEAYRRTVESLQEHGARTMALLGSVRDEMADEIDRGRQARQAAGRYATANRL
jgi:uncharacterized membrane-anchored protein